MSQTYKYENLIVENLFKTAVEVDRIMLEAVEAGMESGRSIGVIEAYNLLFSAGYYEAAECLIKLIEEEDNIRKSIADA
jgi:hypothetical protein